MRSLRRWAASFALLLAAGSLNACGAFDSGSGAAPESANGATPVRLAFTPGSPTLQVHLAEKLGFFDQHGLDVTLTEGSDLPTWAAGLGRQWDVALATSGIFVTGASKFDLVAVAGAQVNREGVLGNPLVTNNPSIKKPIDLEGKRIGVLTLTGTTPASLAYLVQKAGGDPASMKLVQVPFGSQADQLKSKQVDAVVSATPYYSSLLADPENTALFDVPGTALREIAPDVEETAFLLFTSSRTWADENPETVTAMRDSLQQGIDYMKDNPDESKQAMSEWLGISKEVLDKAPWPPPTSATVTKEEVEPTLELYRDRGLIAEADVPQLDDRFKN